LKADKFIASEIQNTTSHIPDKNIAQTFWGNLVHETPQPGCPSGEDSVKKYVVHVIEKNSDCAVQVHKVGI
jgi:hypothetical protein